MRSTCSLDVRTPIVFFSALLEYSNINILASDVRAQYRGVYVRQRKALSRRYFFRVGALRRYAA
jgi:hypothetical protein